MEIIQNNSYTSSITASFPIDEAYTAAVSYMESLGGNFLLEDLLQYCIRATLIDNASKTEDIVNAFIAINAVSYPITTVLPLPLLNTTYDTEELLTGEIGLYNTKSDYTLKLGCINYLESVLQYIRGIDRVNAYGGVLDGNMSMVDVYKHFNNIIVAIGLTYVNKGV